jgi:putative ABC transport system substrate-binding protein
VALAAHHAVPAIYEWRESRGRRPDQLRIEPLRLVSPGWGLCRPDSGGAKPADLPVQQPTTFELVVNLNTAKDLGPTSPIDPLAPTRLSE